MTGVEFNAVSITAVGAGINGEIALMLSRLSRSAISARTASCNDIITDTLGFKLRKRRRARAHRAGSCQKILTSALRA